MKDLQCMSPCPSTCMYAMVNVPNEPYVVCVREEAWKKCLWVKKYILRELCK